MMMMCCMRSAGWLTRSRAHAAHEYTQHIMHITCMMQHQHMQHNIM
nr:MAG TPA: hypothetical protein [Caudoviricetes sp.]